MKRLYYLLFPKYDTMFFESASKALKEGDKDSINNKICLGWIIHRVDYVNESFYCIMIVTFRKVK